MYPVSAAFLAAVRQSHTIATRLDVCTLDGSVLLSDVKATSGQVTIDVNRATRRECSFTIPDVTGTLVPALASDVLSPLTGHELRPYRGVKYPDGSTELVPLGVFPIREAPAATEDDGVAVLSVVARDRASTVSRNRWTVPFSIAAGTTLEAAITALLADRAPFFPVNFPTTGATVPATALGLETDNDPWADAQRLAESAGWLLYFDATGTATMQQPLDPFTVTPSLSYVNDSQTVVMTPSKTWDVEKAYNGAVVIGESSNGAPVRVEVWDDDPSSPTYYLGDYGKFPEFLSSTTITTVEQATGAALSMRIRQKGVGQTVEWKQVVNPALDGNDAVLFTSPDLRITTALVAVFDSLTIPWSATEAGTSACRTQQVIV